MAQSEHLDQPDDAADLGSAVQLDSADTLDGPAGGADALDAGYVPPDRPVALDDDGVTGAGMRDGDSLDERLARERPEETAGDPDRSGRLTVAGGGAALETWMIDHAGDALADVSRQLAYVDAQGGRPERAAGSRADRNVRLFLR